MLIVEYRVTGTDHDGYCSGEESKPIDYVCIKIVESDKLQQIENFDGCTEGRCCGGSGYCEGVSQQTWTHVRSTNLTKFTKKQIIELINRFNKIVIDHNIIKIGERFTFHQFNDIIMNANVFDYRVCHHDFYEELQDIKKQYSFIVTQVLDKKICL